VPFTFTRLAIPEVILVESGSFPDHRGWFAETYRRSIYSENGIQRAFVQENCSRSGRGVLRGLHYQKHPAAQAKLVSVVRGEIFDVAVDIRKGSPFYGKWVAALLSEQNHRLLFIPEGFAHGFVALSDQADTIYKVTAEYCAENESGIVWSDPAINIDWPIKDPLLSAKDAQLPTLENADNNFVY